MDQYKSWSDEALNEHRIGIIMEQERRAKIAQLPDQLADMARDAVEAGCDPDELLGRVTDALTPEQTAALDT